MQSLVQTPCSTFETAILSSQVLTPHYKYPALTKFFTRHVHVTCPKRKCRVLRNILESYWKCWYGAVIQQIVVIEFDEYYQFPAKCYLFYHHPANIIAIPPEVIYYPTRNKLLLLSVKNICSSFLVYIDAIHTQAFVLL